MDISVEGNLNLVHYVLSKINIYNNEYEALYQEGVIGLIKASGTYNIGKNIKFSTYAYVCIKNEILHYIKKIHLMYIWKMIYFLIHLFLIIFDYIGNNELNTLENLIQSEEQEKIKEIIEIK